MKPPKYRVGQTIYTYSKNVCINTEQSTVACRILYPVIDGSYFVKVISTGGYVMLKESQIIGTPEYTNDDVPIQPKYVHIVFFGNGLFALPTLKLLVQRGYVISAVVTMPDKPQGRGHQPKASAIKEYALAHNIPVLQPTDLSSDDFCKTIDAMMPNLGVVVDFRILPRRLYIIPAWGTINLHSALLPQYRGASTIASAIRDGNTLTGVTTFYLQPQVDVGDVINNLAVPIEDDDTAADVHLKLRNAGATMVEDAILRIFYNCMPVPQSELVCDFLQPSYAPKLHKSDCQIPWHKSARDVYNFIRALSPVPTAWTKLKMIGEDKAVNAKIYKASITDVPTGEHAPGELFQHKRMLCIACRDYALSIESILLPGKKRMTALEFLNGFRKSCKGFCEPVPNLPDNADVVTDAE